MTRFGSVSEHLEHLRLGLASLDRQSALVDSWGQQLTTAFVSGQKLLAAGNGGSAAEAQHLTAELVGRFEGDREPLPAIALHVETSTLTAICNDFGPETIFARQVGAHGRSGDVLVLLSTSGRSPNLIEAAKKAKERGLRVWALTGPRDNPLAELADETLAVECSAPTAVQEVHLVAVHALCSAVERYLPSARWAAITTEVSQ
ncbi:D-sedoheptulose-7-phosphate isomerase [Kribbella sp. CA-293567]|uniref:D-sedoheptulose-7-phosphate isomerase n=1 Tax=Kribbella sp. CA-293567 TaxID=3002436 RepID=UPI0022DE6321|nr:SIS domain-containing protein [Kribbella sp. CA-293567]WBQ08309.1 SIS domain-containing protein [Kribbella sp. CA-293567]